MGSDLFNVKKQLAFYGAYHSNKINIAIHMLFVPLIQWSAQVLLADVELPRYFPYTNYHYVINDYLAFDLKLPAFMACAYLIYFFLLEPVAGLLYAPQMALSLLTATAFAQKSPVAFQTACVVHGASWVAQFAGHGFAEKKAPALLDNLVGALVLAPFFVHIEILFALGYRPTFAKEMQNEIGKEVVRARSSAAETQRLKFAKRKEDFEVWRKQSTKEEADAEERYQAQRVIELEREKVIVAALAAKAAASKEKSL